MATARTIEFTTEDLESSGNYNIEPGVYDLKLTRVKDHMSKAGNPGWKWTFTVLKGGATFDLYTVFTQKARWKLVEVLTALGWEPSEGLESVDPDLYVGVEVSGDIQYQKEDEFSASMEGQPRYLELARIYRKVDKSDLPDFDQLRGSVEEGDRDYDPSIDGEQF